MSRTFDRTYKIKAAWYTIGEMEFNKKIYLIVFSYFVLFFISPPFQMPDEPDHYQTIYFFSRLTYPRLSFDKDTPTDYEPSKTFEKVYRTTQVASENYTIPDFGKIRKFFNWKNRTETFPTAEKPLSKQGHQPPLYYAVGALFFLFSTIARLDSVTQFYFIRLVSALFYFLSIAVAYRILKVFFKNTSVAQNMLVFFAINPIVIKMGITINPDIALMFFSLVAFFFALRYSSKAGSPLRNILLFSFISAMATLSKFQGIFLVPFFVFFLLMKKGWNTKTVRDVLIFFFSFLLMVSPWLAVNMLRYGAPIVDNFSIMCKQNLPDYGLFGALFQALFEFRHTFMHYAGFWGWGEPYPFKPFFIAYTIAFCLLLFVGAWHIRKAPKYNILLAFMLPLFFFLFLVSTRHKLLHYSCDIQGRYILPVFLVLSVLVFKGAQAIFRKKTGTISLWFFWFSLFQFYFILFFVIIPKYYV